MARIAGWLDGRLVDGPEVERALESLGPGCYTTARVCGARVRWLERHQARLARDAPAFGLPAVAPAPIARAFAELGEAVFPGREGIVRLDARPDADGAPHLLAHTRELGPEPTTWRVALSPVDHPGRGAPLLRVKPTHFEAYARAREARTATPVDDVLMVDEKGHVVELARANVLIVDAAGQLVAPPIERGSVAGLALEWIGDCEPGLRFEDISLARLAAAREVLASNAVRGVVPVVALDGRRVGDGRAGPVARRLAGQLPQF